MDILRSCLFKNEPLISWTFLSSKSDSPVLNQNIGDTFLHRVSVSPMFWLQENLILTKETDQRFILKEITSKKIHNLILF